MENSTKGDAGNEDVPRVVDSDKGRVGAPRSIERRPARHARRRIDVREGKEMAEMRRSTGRSLRGKEMNSKCSSELHLSNAAYSQLEALILSDRGDGAQVIVIEGGLQWASHHSKVRSNYFAREKTAQRQCDEYVLQGTRQAP